MLGVTLIWLLCLLLTVWFHLNSVAIFNALDMCGFEFFVDFELLLLLVLYTRFVLWFVVLGIGLIVVCCY